MYLSLGYQFSTGGSTKPFVFGRLGYSINRMGAYSIGLYEEGLLPEVSSPVEAGGTMVTRTSTVRDLEPSPYIAIGMGLRFNESFSIQAMYSYTNVRFRVFYPTSYTYYNSTTSPASYTTESFNVVETHQMDCSQVQLMAGYRFGGPAESHPSPAPSSSRGKPWFSGFELMLGLDKNLPMTSTLTHINTTVVNRYGEVARSTQDVVNRPVKPVSVSVGLQYAYPVWSQVDLGLGVLYKFRRDYEKVQTSSTGSYTQIRIEDFSNTVTYLLGRYRFPSASHLEPYFIGRLGYSFNRLKYNKYSNETVMAGVSASDVKGGVIRFDWNRHPVVRAPFC